MPRTPWHQPDARVSRKTAACLLRVPPEASPASTGETASTEHAQAEGSLACMRSNGCHPWRARRPARSCGGVGDGRSEEHTSELQSHVNLVCRLLLEKKKK